MPGCRCGLSTLGKVTSPEPPLRIVLTRHPGQGSALEHALRDSGFQVAHLPVTAQLLPEDISPLERAVKELAAGCYDWLLLTSATTVRALRAAGWNGEIPAATHVGVVGPGTAAALKDLAPAPSPWMPADHSAAGILAELPAPQAGHHMLLPQSAQARPELAEGLRSRGWDLHHVIAYQTAALDRLPEGHHRRLMHPTGGEPSSPGAHKSFTAADLREADVVLVTSSSAADALLRLPLPAELVLLAIGKPTAAALAQLGRPADAVLSQPTAAGVQQALSRL